MQRRKFLSQSIVFVSLSTLFAKLAQAATDLRERTPSQTEGPFYPREFPADADWNLLKVGSGTDIPDGEALALSGRVIDPSGRPLPGITVEIWQVDGKGIYNHPDAGGRGRFDERFQGYGRTETDADGGYKFLTLVPAVYPGRPPHIHVKLRRDGKELLTTQLYIKGHPRNGDDGIFAALLFRNKDQLQMDLRPMRLTDKIEGKQTTFDFVV